ncbi:MAG: hypothetical protein IT529_04630 [Burkholderiales bacterium]|nr:hypothetical protein [Burkholderiales bacterium]
MAISDAQYESWLKADNRLRALLVEADAYSGGALVTRYMATFPYQSTPGDTPASTAYDDIVLGVPAFSADIGEALGGRGQGGWGSISIKNEAPRAGDPGLRDAWLDDGWDGRALTLYFGDPSWPKSDFRRILAGVSADIVALSPNLTLLVRDKTWLTNVPLQTALVGGTTANKDQLKPLCLGQCFNVEPVLIDAAAHKYQVHDGAIEDITAVREGGNATTYNKQLADGTFTLNGSPTLRITCDVKGAKPSGTWLTKCADLIEWLMTTRTQLSATDIDATSFSDFNTLCPQTLGFYASSFTSVGSVIDALVASVGGYWAVDRTGKFVLGRLDAPSGTAALEIMADDVAAGGLRILSRLLPVKTARLGYQRNWAPQVDGLAGVVTEANRALYAAEYQAVTRANSGVDTAHLLAESPDLAGTLLADATEAQTEVNRRGTLRGQLRYIYEASCFCAPFTLRLGQEVRLTHPRYGFEAGRNAIVVGFQEFPTRKRAAVRLFA